MVLRAYTVVVVVVCWLLNVLATCWRISGTDLLRHVYVMPHWDGCWQAVDSWGENEKKNEKKKTPSPKKQNKTKQTNKKKTQQKTKQNKKKGKKKKQANKHKQTPC